MVRSYALYVRARVLAVHVCIHVCIYTLAAACSDHDQLQLMHAHEHACSTMMHARVHAVTDDRDARTHAAMPACMRMCVCLHVHVRVTACMVTCKLVLALDAVDVLHHIDCHQAVRVGEAAVDRWDVCEGLDA